MKYELQAIGDQLTSEARALAEHLRTLFRVLDLSVRRYATRCHSDPGTVSRYLNGTRIPPWPFVRNLLTEVAANRQQPLQRAVIEHTRELHRAALRVSNSNLYEMQNLQDQLEEADRVQQRADLREQALLEAMQARQHRIAELEMGARELESENASVKTRYREDIGKYERERESTREEVDRLKQEIIGLRQQLSEARDLTREAKERCVELEQQIEKVEISAEAGSENRVDEELKIARRETADAVSRAEALEETLERFRRKVKGATEKLARPMPVEVIPEIADDVYDRPDRLADYLLRNSATVSEHEARGLARRVSKDYPVAKMGDLIRELKERLDDRTIGALSSNFANSRTPRENFELIKNLGWDFKRFGNRTLCDSILTWFAWNGDTSRIREMLELLEGFASNEPIQEVFEAIAKRKSSTVIVELMEGAGSEAREIMVRALATDREITEIPNTLAALREAGYSDMSQRFLAEVARVRPGSIDRLVLLFDAIDSHEDKAMLASSKPAGWKGRLRRG